MAKDNVDSDENIVTLIENIVTQILQQKTREQIIQMLAEKKVSAEAAEVLIQIAISVGIAGEAIRNGVSRELAIEGMELPPQHRQLAECALPAVIAARKKYPLDTIASNPGRIDLRMPQYLKYNARKILAVSVLFLSVDAALYLYGHSLWTGLLYFARFWFIFYLLIMYWMWYAKKIKFKYGCMNPAIVISTAPSIIAVYGNLGRGRRSFNVVKILRAKLNSGNCADFRIGARIATAATYEYGLDDTHWSDFFPEPVNYATTDRVLIRSSLDTFDEELWGELEMALEKVMDKSKIGLYPINCEFDPQKVPKSLLHAIRISLIQ